MWLVLTASIWNLPVVNYFIALLSVLAIVVITKSK